MKTIKVIDLLNKIVNGEEVPKKIKFCSDIYEYDNRTDELYNYKREDGKYLDEVWLLTNILNNEVEIIEDTPKEDKKIEHINKVYDLTDFRKDYPIVAEMLKDLSNKQYEIIDELEKLKSKPTIININNTPTMQEPYKITWFRKWKGK